MDEVLTRAGFFRGVDPELAVALRSEFESVYYPHGAVIFSAGELDDRLYIISTGKVKLGRNSSDGRGSLLAIMGPADMFGELSVFDPGPHTLSATAVTDVHMATISHGVLHAWITKRPEIAEQLLRVLARRLRRTNSNLADLVFTDVPGRVAKTLLQLGQRFGQPEGHHLRVMHDLTQEELAQLIGASRETVNKALSDFGHRGWLRLEGKSVIILDSDRLSRRAQCSLEPSRPTNMSQKEESGH